VKHFTADLHIGHKNIIEYCDRPFRKADGQPDAEAMTHRFLENFASVLRPGDDLYILGDLSFNAGQAIKFLDELKKRVGNMNMFMVWGNHDPDGKDRKEIEKRFVKTGELYEAKLKNGTRAIMCHYPMLRWNKGHFGSYMLHGHVHGELRYPEELRILDVGVDSEVALGYPTSAFWHPKYFPFSEDEIIRYMQDRPEAKHHTRDM
jgi:calcineurin-like phosphoesterase family protein